MFTILFVPAFASVNAPFAVTVTVSLAFTPSIEVGYTSSAEVVPSYVFTFAVIPEILSSFFATFTDIFFVAELYLPDTSEAVTVIVALPAPFITTFPLLSTLTTLLFDEVYDNVAPVSAGSSPTPISKLSSP